MSEAIVLDTPSQINLWVLLSRRHQLQMQMRGLKTPGIVKWVRDNIEGAENVRNARQCVIPIEEAISMAGGQIDFKLVNVQILERVGNVMLDLGIVNSFDEVQADPGLMGLYDSGALDLVLTHEPPRCANGDYYY